MLQLQLALEQSREEVRKLRSDLQSSQYRTKQLSLEVGMLNERSATAKAQERLSIIRSKTHTSSSKNNIIESSRSSPSDGNSTSFNAADKRRPAALPIIEVINSNPRCTLVDSDNLPTNITADTYRDDRHDRQIDVTAKCSDPCEATIADDKQATISSIPETHHLLVDRIDYHDHQQKKESMVKNNLPADPLVAVAELTIDSASSNKVDSMDDLISRDIEISRRLISPAAIIQRPPRWRNRCSQDPRDATQPRAAAMKEIIHPNSDKISPVSFICSDSELTNERRQTICQKHAIDDSPCPQPADSPPISADQQYIPHSRRSKVSGTVEFIKQRVASSGLLSVCGVSRMHQLSQGKITLGDECPQRGVLLEQDNGSVDEHQRQDGSVEMSILSRPSVLTIGIGGDVRGDNDNDDDDGSHRSHLSKLKLLVEKVKFR